MKGWIGNQVVSRRTVSGRILPFFFSLMLLAGTPVVAWADVPESFRISPWPQQRPGQQADVSPALQAADQSVPRLLVDTDSGVDDAAALIWLLSQHRYPVEFLGVVTVAGNTTVENATNNVLLLLSLAGYLPPPPGAIWMAAGAANNAGSRSPSPPGVA